MKTLIVTRPVGQATTTIEALKERGYEVLHAPIMHPTEISFETPDPDAALIVTSQNGVRFGLEALEDRNQFVYAVGRRTADAARNAGFENVKEGPGTAKGMIPMLLEIGQAHGVSFAHLCGEDLAYNIVERLTAEGVQANTVTTYKMVQAHGLPEEVLTALEAEDVDGVLFHSARTARAFEELVSEHGLTNALMTCHAYTFSSRIKAELIGPWKLKSHAIVPDEKTLFDLIDRRIDKRDFEP